MELKSRFEIILYLLVIISVVFNLIVMKPFSVEPREINENVTIGVKNNLTLSIKHIGLPRYSDQNLKYEVDGIDTSWIKPPNETPLRPNEIEFIGLTVDIPNGTIPGRYNGKILVKTENKHFNHHQEIKTSLNVIEAVSNEVVPIMVHQDW